MAEPAKKDQREDREETTEESSATQPKAGMLSRFGVKKSLAVVLMVSVLNFVVGFGLSHLLGGSGPETLEPEIELGQFHFSADQSELGRIAAAEFSMHIAFLEHVDTPARKRLQDRWYRVRQDIEEMLRQAHGGDFDDPSLGELKRQVQEQLNETLGLRAIADVIITDLQLTHSESDVAAVSETADAVPWTEKPSG